MRQTNGPSRTKAIVIGASMAGLLAAAALAKHFEEVVLLERDALPAPGKNRKGVPQGKHTHVLLERGHKVMERLLPGLTEALAEWGAVTIADASANFRWFYDIGYHEQGLAGFSGLAVSRPTLEGVVREKVKGLANVCIVENCNARRPVTTADKQRVTGVVVVHRGAERREQETMDADLVVDAGGRGSRSPAWLEELGYERPQEEKLRVDIGYVSCFFRRQPQDLPGLEGMLLIPAPPSKRLAALMAQDGMRWVLTVAGYLGEHAPADYEGFLEAARQLPTPDFYEVVKDAEPLTEPVAYNYRANWRRRYDKLHSFPQGYLVLGDALCSFNPIYGQGMTVAALEAEALEACLTQGQAGLGKRFFAATREIVDEAWQTAVSSDLSFEGVQGERSPALRFLHWYMARLHAAARRDAQVSIAFIKVLNMLAPQQSVLHPRILWRVLKAYLWPG